MNAALPDSRIKEIYSQYVVAKRKCSESTADVTLEQLTQSLREASTKLKQKHPTGVVDFEVVVRNGHALLKPVVRGM